MNAALAARLAERIADAIGVSHQRVHQLIRR